jgi:putative nucleotidyltransferase with HDIG domain
LFTLLYAVAQLSEVELLQGSHSRVSVSSIATIASVILFGPLTGAFTILFGELFTFLVNSFIKRERQKGGFASLRRLGFNVGMFVIASSFAGCVYLLAGGSIGTFTSFPELLPLAAAVAVDTLANLVILIGVISLQTCRSPLVIWNQDFRWGAPINILGGIIGGGMLALAYKIFGAHGLMVFFLPVLATSYSFRLYVKNTKVYVNKLEHLNRELEQVNDGLMETLAAVIDAYDAYTRTHSKQVKVYAGDLAEKLHLPPEEKARIERAALVHDLGKVGVMDTIIGKEGRLTAEEYNIVKRHPAIGAEILDRMEGLQELVPLVKHHHERWDGKGYPDGLTGEEIPLGARILAIADTVDAIRSDRPYRPTRNFREVKEEIIRCSGSQFDPVVVEAFLALLEERGPDYFKNSSHGIKPSLGADGVSEREQGGKHFLKKSMLSVGQDEEALAPSSGPHPET